MTKAEVERMIAERASSKEPVYPYEPGDVKDVVDSKGGLILAPQRRAFRIRPDLDISERILAGSRSKLAELLEEEKIDDDYEIQQGEFIVVDTPKLIMPAGTAALLKINDFDNMSQPGHLNSPIVDSKFGHSTDGYNGHLRLELYQPHPHAVKIDRINVRLFFFRENIIDAVAS